MEYSKINKIVILRIIALVLLNITCIFEVLILSNTNNAFSIYYIICFGFGIFLIIFSFALRYFYVKALRKWRNDIKRLQLNCEIIKLQQELQSFLKSKGIIRKSEKLNFGYWQMLEAITHAYLGDSDTAIKLLDDTVKKTFNNDESNPTFIYVYLDLKSIAYIYKKEYEEFINITKEKNLVLERLDDSLKTQIMVQGEAQDLLALLLETHDLDVVDAILSMIETTNDNYTLARLIYYLYVYYEKENCLEEKNYFKNELKKIEGDIFFTKEDYN